MTPAPVAIVAQEVVSSSFPQMGRLLWAIRQVEEVPGRPVSERGEVGAYQFTPATWARFTEWPLWCALDEQKARIVAETALRAYGSELSARGIPVTCYNLACCWVAGDNAVVLHGFLSQKVKSYATRVSNLVNNP